MEFRLRNKGATLPPLLMSWGPLVATMSYPKDEHHILVSLDVSPFALNFSPQSGSQWVVHTPLSHTIKYCSMDSIEKQEQDSIAYLIAQWESVFVL